MSGGRPSYGRLVSIALKLAPVILRYRVDRRRIVRAGNRVDDPRRYREHAARAVDALIGLGPAFIKLGQVLSVRPDVLPAPYIEEFSRLQDEVPPAPFELVRPIIEEELGPIGDVFERFDQDPISGASLSQVYRARYRGEEVVVKVHRPRVEEEVEEDLAAVRALLPLAGRLVDRSFRASLEAAIDQLSHTIMDELDYVKEAENMEAIRGQLGGRKDVLIPRVFREASTHRVLVMEYLGGIKVTDVQGLDAAGLDRRRIAHRVARLFLSMMLEGGVFHADPHPGNISVTPDGRIVLYDFGMAGRLDKGTRSRLLRLHRSIVGDDPDGTVQMLWELGAIQPGADMSIIRRAVELMLWEAKGEGMIPEMEVRELMIAAGRAIYGFPFRLPEDLVLFVRMLIVLEGVCQQLDQEFRFIPVLSSILREEGVELELYREELLRRIDKITKALDAALDVAPMLRERLLYGGQPPPRGGGSFWAGLAAGLGAAAVAAWIALPKDGPDYLLLAAGAVAMAVGISKAADHT